MKKFYLFLFLALSAAQFYAQNDSMMAAWQEYMTPGEVHQFFEQYTGNWTGEITMWMGPSAEPVKTTGTAVYTSILGGRYFHAENKSDYMGMPMIGIETFGYDKAKRKHFLTWIDNFGTGIMYLEGDMNETKNKITYTGLSTDPMGQDINVRYIVNFIDKDNMLAEMFMMYDGNEFKTMEIKYSRIK